MTENVIHDEEDLRFYISYKDDEAELTYTYPETQVMDLDNTYVPEELRGQGIAEKLVKAGLEYARSMDYKVIPSCPVVEAFIKRNPEYEEMVQPE